MSRREMDPLDHHYYGPEEKQKSPRVLRISIIVLFVSTVLFLASWYLNQCTETTARDYKKYGK